MQNRPEKSKRLKAPFQQPQRSRPISSLSGLISKVCPTDVKTCALSVFSDWSEVSSRNFLKSLTQLGASVSETMSLAFFSCVSSTGQCCDLDANRG